MTACTGKHFNLSTMKKHYLELLDVPEQFQEYLSANLLNQDYWAHSLTRSKQRQIECCVREWLNIPLPNFETDYDIETKIEDIDSDIVPIVPKLCNRQGLLFVWTTPLYNADEITASAIEFKLEPQSVKSSVADNCEVMIAQVHQYDTFVFISSVKYYNYIARMSKCERIMLIETVWKTLIELFKDKTIYAATASSLNQAHQIFNNKNIQHEPYSEKLMRRMGFRYNNIDIPELYVDRAWKYEHKPST